MSIDYFTLDDRIRKIRKDQKMIQKDFADVMGVAPITIIKYEKGDRIPDAEFLNKLVQKFNCNPAWLIDGEGPMYKEAVKKVVSDNNQDYNKDTGDPYLEEIIQLLKEDPSAEKFILEILRSRKNIKTSLRGLLEE